MQKNTQKKNNAVVEKDLNHFLMLMDQKGLNTTKQRINIAKVFFCMADHHSLEEIYSANPLNLPCPKWNKSKEILPNSMVLSFSTTSIFYWVSAPTACKRKINKRIFIFLTSLFLLSHKLIFCQYIPACLKSILLFIKSF